jgi:hypothetical protein
VWYFGEDVNNYWNGILIHHAGSFLHGKDGAKAGIWMKADQRVGDSYRQEFYINNAEDIRDTIATGQAVTTKARKYTDCVKVLDWTPLEKNAREHKYYCPEVRSLVLIEDLETGSRSELVDVVKPQPRYFLGALAFGSLGGSPATKLKALVTQALARVVSPSPSSFQISGRPV